MANANLGAARKAKNDEFYTQWADIEREMNAYLEYDPDVFRGKVVLLPCDDPEWSNFSKYFALHFDEFGIKKLISTSYAPASNPAIDEDDYQPTLFETESPSYDREKSKARGKKFVLERDTDITGDGRVDIDDLQWDYLEGDGDFRSDEVTALRDEADMVITNPPFSLFREFVNWLVAGEVEFSIIGTNNAATYNEVFRLIQTNKIWKGATGATTDMVFAVPKGSNIKESDRQKAARLGYPATTDRDFTRLGNACWYTNIQHGRRHQPLTLLSEADNKMFSRWKEVNGVGYHRFVNLDAIDVPRVDAIPSDYPGMMAVPVTFLDKYNPEQFEILANMDDHTAMRKLGVQPISEEFMAGYRAAGGTGAQRAGGYWSGLENPHRFPFKRILIRHLNPATKEC